MNAPGPKLRPWVPDLFIVGAMKAGTTSLHHMLAQHPQIYIPDGEVGYFDCDEYFEHLDWFSDARGRWLRRDFDADPAAGLAWYGRFFTGARPGQRIGEDSTTYLSSQRAAARIAQHNPAAKIVIQLREPAERAYSQYWHMLRTGRVMHSFEDTLRLMPERILARSLYVPQVRRFLDHFDRAQLLFVVFEEFVRDPAPAYAGALRLLGLEPAVAVPLEHRNPALIPRSPALQRWRNRWLWRTELGRYVKHLRGLPPADGAPAGETARWLNALYRRLNPQRPAKPPPMRADTREFLTAMLRRENAGLSDLIGRDLSGVWYARRN